MPMGKGTYGSKRGRPPKKNKMKKKKDLLFLEMVMKKEVGYI